MRWLAGDFLIGIAAIVLGTISYYILRLFKIKHDFTFGELTGLAIPVMYGAFLTWVPTVPAAQSCETGHGYGYGLSSPQEPRLARLCNVGLRCSLVSWPPLGGPSRFPFRGVLTQLPKPN